MENIKLVMTIGLPGRNMVAEENIDENYEITVIKNVEWKENGKTLRENLTVKTRGFEPAEEKVNLNNETFKAFQSSIAPAWAKKELWNKMNTKQRLEANLQRHAEALGGWLVNYAILDD